MRQGNKGRWEKKKKEKGKEEKVNIQKGMEYQNKDEK